MDWEGGDQAVPGYVQEVEVVESNYGDDDMHDAEKYAFSLQFKGEHAQPTKDSKTLWSRLSDGTKKELQNKMQQMKVEKQNGDADMKDLKSYIPELNEAISMDVQKLPVKKLRKLIPILRILVYMPEHLYEGKKKLKHLWDEKPADWPNNTPFVDPNNGNKVSNGKINKPGKHILLKMFQFLKEKYQQWTKTGKCQPVQEERSMLAIKEAPRHDGFSRPIDRTMTRRTAFKVEEHNTMQPIGLLTMGSDPAKNLLVRLQPRFEQIRGLGGDHPGLESLEKLERLIESLFEHDKRKFIQLGHDLERLFDELFMMDAKQEDWSKFREDCKDLSDRWLSSLLIDSTQMRPQEVLVCHMGEEVIADAPVQNRFIPQTDGPYLPDLLLSEKKPDMSVKFAKQQKETESEEVHQGEFAVETLGIEFRQPIGFTDIGNLAKQKSDNNQKGQDKMCDDQNFKHPQSGHCDADDPMWYTDPGDDESLKFKAIDEVLALEASLALPNYELQTMPQASLTHTEIATTPATGATYTILEALSADTSSQQGVQSISYITDSGTIVTKSSQAQNCVILLDCGEITSCTPVDDPNVNPFFNTVSETETTTAVSKIPTTPSVTTPPSTTETAMLHNLLQSQGLSGQELSPDQLQYFIYAAQRSANPDYDQIIEHTEIEPPVQMEQEAKPCLSNLLPTVVEEMDME